MPGALVPALSSTLSSILGLALRDVLLTKDEYSAMASGLADTDLGIRYANELSRRFS